MGSELRLQCYAFYNSFNCRLAILVRELTYAIVLGRLQAVDPMANDVLLTLQSRAGVASRELWQLSRSGCAEQCHLDAGSTEQAYWHHGYHSAVVDVMRILGREPIDVEIRAAR